MSYETYEDVDTAADRWLSAELYRERTITIGRINGEYFARFNEYGQKPVVCRSSQSTNDAMAKALVELSALQNADTE